MEEFRNAISVSEGLSFDAEAVADTPAEFLQKVQELRAIQPEKVTCEQAKFHHHDMAFCDLAVPAEIYRHTRHCASCKDQVQQLRSELNVAIPRSDSPEFEKLLAGKGELSFVPAAEKVRLRGPGRVGIFLERHWRKLTIGAAAAAAAVIIALLVIPPTQAMAVTFEQVCKAFAKIQFVHIQAYPQGQQFIQVVLARGSSGKISFDFVRDS